MQPVGRALFDALRAAVCERAAVGLVGDPATGGGWLMVPLDATTDASVEAWPVGPRDAGGVVAHAADATSRRATTCAFMVIRL
jgi:hypothetical protein